MLKYLKNKKGNNGMEIFLVINVSIIMLIIFFMLSNIIKGYFNSTGSILSGTESTKIEQNLIVK